MDNVEKIYFSRKNYYLLLDVIFEHFSKEFQYTINDYEETLCLEVMKHIYGTYPKKPNNVKITDHIKQLNKSCLNEVITVITKKIHQDMVPIDDLENITPESTSNNTPLHIDSRQTVYNSVAGGRVDTTFNTDRINSDDVSKSFDILVKDRNQDTPVEKKGRPQEFEEILENDNSAVGNRFDNELKNRGYNDNPLPPNGDIRPRNELNEDHKFDEYKEHILGFEKVQGQDQEIKGYDQGPVGLFAGGSSRGKTGGGNDTSLLGEPLDHLGQIITDNKEDAIKAMSSVETLANQDTFFGGQTPKPSGQDVLIKQPEGYNKLFKEYYKGYTKDYFLVVDSRDRNQDRYSNPANYQIDFNEVYKDILSIELISAEIPKSTYTINSSNNKIYFQETATQVSNDTFYTGTIPIGNYSTASDLATAIQTAMDGATGSEADYTVSVLSTTNKLSISSNFGGSATLFNLLFDGGTEKYNATTRTVYKENSIGPVIGFSRADLTGTTVGVAYTGQNQYNLNGENYIFLNIKELENLDSINDSQGSGTDSFTKITLDADTTNRKFYKAEHDYISKVVFVPPLAKLGQMIIKFITYNNDIYDFGGLEHSLYFRITTFNQSQNYFGQSANTPAL